LSATVSGLLAALLGTTRLAERAPAVVGVKLTSTVQLAPPLRNVFEQESLASAKSPAPAPPVASWVIARLVPGAAVLLIVTCFAVLVEPIGWSPKLKPDGASPTCGGSDPDGEPH
jgi:hypothetical protein